jgi:cytochrome P450
MTLAEHPHRGVPTTDEIGSPRADHPDLRAYFDQLRELGDVVWDETSSAYLATSYELCREIARGEGEAGLWDPYPVPGAGQPPSGGVDDETWLELTQLGSARVLPLGPRHKPQHRWWMELFTPRVVSTWREEFIRPICHAQIDRFAGAGRAELVADYAARIAPRLFVRLMGAEDAGDEFADYLTGLFAKRDQASHQRIFSGSGDSNQEVLDAGLAASGELRKALHGLVLSRRDGRGDDLISAVWRDADDVLGPGWDESDVLGFAMVLWNSASGTTIYSTANGLYLLLSRPDLRERVQREPALLANLLEESLRLYGLVMNRPRIARKDFEFAGVQIRVGDLMRPVYGAASRDPRHYPRPDEVDLERRLPRDHLSFGTGGHSCAGQAIARIELEDSVAVLLERLPDIELDPDAEPPSYGHGISTRMWKPLNVRF